MSKKVAKHGSGSQKVKVAPTGQPHGLSEEAWELFLSLYTALHGGLIPEESGVPDDRYAAIAAFCELFTGHPELGEMAAGMRDVNDAQRRMDEVWDRQFPG